ncbi:helix-turn-helix domain-containing protein, partial [Klebsiella pneumoniae]
FIQQSRFDRPAPEIKEAKLHQLMGARWPGNVRELRNEAERFVLGRGVVNGTSDGAPASLTQTVENFERSVIATELERHDNNLSRTAEALQVAKSTLSDKMKKYGLKAGS